AKIAQERALDEERILRERETQRLEVERRKALELEEQGRAIAIAAKSREQSEAQAEAETARAKAVAAEEKVFSARETEIAERRKQIELIAAQQEAEREAIRARVLAEGERHAAVDRAEAVRLEAEGASEAEKIRALAAKLRYEIEAEGQRLLNEAANTLTPESRGSAMRLKLLDKIEGIIRESVKPMERIEGIKILHVDGLTGGGTATVSEGGTTFADNVVNSALRYRAQAPLIDSLLKEIGISSSEIGKLTNVMGEGEKKKE
ncbi:MAG TPA: flotillin domain-containing protein, partial [Kiloniellales bacterium]|nr:flotillin domain-containing protein [Kiloniellales bacterium]